MNEIAKELLDACKQAAEQIRRCDYTPARSTLLTAIKKAEAAMAEGKPDADGWVKWAGGECPVDGKTKVDVRFLNGDELFGCDTPWLAGDYDWAHENSTYDIIAYRIVKEPQ